MNIEYLHTLDNIANIFTENLIKERHQACLYKLSVIETLSDYFALAADGVNPFK